MNNFQLFFNWYAHDNVELRTSELLTKINLELKKIVTHKKAELYMIICFELPDLAFCAFLTGEDLEITIYCIKN